MTDLKEQINQKNKEKEEMIHENDQSIKELNQRIEEMSSDFADMLKDTLSKMQDRIEFANGKDWQEDGDNQIKQQFDHLTSVAK